MRVQRGHFIWIAAIVIALLAAYANSFHNSFHFDDYHTIVNNPAIRSLRNIPRFFTDTSTFSVLPANRTYRPLVSTSLAFDYWIGHGLRPFFFHIGTFIVYLLQLSAMVLLFRGVLDRIRPEQDNFLVALFATAWYGLHPAMAETVNYVIQRGDIYAACGVVYALLLYAALPQLRRTGLYLLPFVLGLLSKPPAIVFPALLFAYVAMFEASSEKRWRFAALLSLPACITGGLVLWFEGAMTPKSYTPSTLSNFSWFITQPFVLLRAFGTFFLPIHLNVDTDLRAFTSVNAEAAAGFVFLAALAASIWMLARHRQTRPIAFGLLWFLIASLPTSLYKLAEVENDHRLFLPFIGLALSCTWAGYLALDRLRRSLSARAWQIGVGAALLMLCTCAWATHIRNRVWHTEKSLWYDDVLKCPHNGRGLMNFGLVEMNRGNDQAALNYFERALRYTPNYPTLEINLGIVNGLLADQGQPALAALAEQHFRRAIALAPADDSTHAYYGRWLLGHGRIREAIQQLRTAVALNPAPLMQRNLLIQAEEQAGNSSAAQTIATQTLRMVPADAAARDALKPVSQTGAYLTAPYWINQSLAEYRHGQYLLSIASARHALTLSPQSAAAYNNIGASYGAMHQWDKAILNERLALHYDPTLAIARNNLALFLKKRSPQQVPPSNTAAVAALLNQSLAEYRAANYKASLASALAAIKLDPQSAEAWNNTAAANAAMHRWGPAIAAARKALALKPSFTLARNNLAWAESHLHPAAQ